MFKIRMENLSKFSLKLFRSKQTLYCDKSVKLIFRNILFFFCFMQFKRFDYFKRLLKEIVIYTVVYDFNLYEF